MKKVLLLVAMMLVFLSGCGTVVPPGKRVILIQPNGDTEVHDKGAYWAYGRTKVYFVDQQLTSFSESGMKILCADDINMDIDLKVVMSFDVQKESIDFIKEKIRPERNEHGDFELSLDSFYNMGVQPIVRGTARNIVSAMSTEEIRPNRQKIESEIAQAVKARVAELNYPVNVSAVLLSNIDYPKSVIEMRERIKQAELADQEKAAEAEAMLAQAQREVAIETEQAKSRLVRAEAQADENEILTQSLTPEFLMWRQFEVMENLGKDLAEGQSNSVFMLPYQTMSPDMLHTTMITNAVAETPAK